MKVDDFKKILEKKDEEIAFLYKQVREMKELAEQYGSEIAKYKHEAIRLQEKFDKLKSIR
jgi:hypothetical protein